MINNEEGFTKEMCYVFLAIAALGLVWLFTVGIPTWMKAGVSMAGGP